MHCSWENTKSQKKKKASTLPREMEEKEECSREKKKGFEGRKENRFSSK